MGTVRDVGLIAIIAIAGFWIWRNVQGVIGIGQGIDERLNKLDELISDFSGTIGQTQSISLQWLRNLLRGGSDPGFDTIPTIGPGDSGTRLDNTGMCIWDVALGRCAGSTIPVLGEGSGSTGNPALNVPGGGTFGNANIAPSDPNEAFLPSRTGLRTYSDFVQYDTNRYKLPFGPNGEMTPVDFVQGNIALGIDQYGWAYYVQDHSTLSTTGWAIKRGSNSFGDLPGYLSLFGVN